MLSFNKPSTIIITCHKWLSPYLVQEVQQLGFTIKESFLTGLALTGTLNDCIILNLHLRCASQVLFNIKNFYCNHPDDLYKNVVAYDWRTIIPKEGYFSITSNVYHPSIQNNMFANVRVKDGIVDALQQATGQRPNSGNLLNKTVLHLHWKNTDATLFIDTSGESLGRHGYRKIPGKAPMLEALAAATILATRWKGDTPFINPMCGSGTLAIEAALMATNRKPGLLRNNYGFMHLVAYNDEVYTKALQHLFEIIKPSSTTIIASDISADAIKISKINASNAEVDEIINFQQCDFRQTTMPEQKGIVFINPEYGERLGEASELENTYAGIGNFFKQQCAGYTGYVFTGSMELAKKIGLKPKKRTEFLNGKIDCRLLAYELYEGSQRTTNH